MNKKAIHINSNETIDAIIDKGTLVFPKFNADANADIVIEGGLIKTARDTAQTKKDIVASLETQLATAITEKATAETGLIDAYNHGVDKANAVYPHDITKLTGLGLILSSDNTIPLPVPTIILGCSAVQSEHSGKANMHCHSLKGVKMYMVMETQDLTDLLDESRYYAASPVGFFNSKGGEVVPKTLGTITWWRIYGENSAGKGVWSAPFGGFKVQ